jgi:hypothetical protein
VTDASVPRTTTAIADATDDEGELPAAEDEKDLEPTPLAVSDAAYGDDADDDLWDLGIQLGRMRLTERIGGFVRPKIAEEMASSLETLNPKQSDTQSSESPEPVTPEAVRAAYLQPGPGYIPPASGFFLSQPVANASLLDFLPSRTAADLLISQYFLAVHPIARLVHKPSFDQSYEGFWIDVSLGIEPPQSCQAIVFAAMFSGVVCMDEDAVLRDFGVAKASLVDNFRLGTETALSRASFLRSTKLETLQAFVMYMVCVTFSL